MKEFQPFVSVIVPVFNDEDRIGRAIESIMKQSYPEDKYELIVVDNGSTDKTVKIIRNYNNLKLLIADNKKGPSFARNMGIRSAKGDILAFLDSDCVADARWIKEGARYFSDNNIGGVAGRIKFYFEKSRPNISEYVDSVRYLQQEENIKRGFAATANLFIRKTMFDGFGMFKEDLSTGEDHELCKRFFSMKLSLVYNKDAIVFHPACNSIKKLNSQTRRNALGQKKLREMGIWRYETNFIRVLLPRKTIRKNEYFYGFSLWEKIKVHILFNYLHYLGILLRHL